MRKQVYDILLFCFILGLCFSCTKKKELQQDEWVGKVIYFPNVLYELKGKGCFPLDDFHKKTIGKKKVVSIIDATCRKCIIGQLNRIDSLFVPLLKEKGAEMVFVLNVNSADSLSFMTSLYPEIKSEGLLLWDNAYYFETENNILTEKVNRRTFLLDENNKILLVGNPLFHKDLLKYYETNVE